MIIRFFEPETKQNLFDAKKHKELSGILYFQPLQPTKKTPHAEDIKHKNNKQSEKVNYTDQSFDQLTEEEHSSYSSQNKMHTPIKESESNENDNWLISFTLKLDAIVFPKLLFVYKILFILIHFIKNAYLDFGHQFLTLMIDTASFIKKMSIEKSPKNIEWFGSTKAEQGVNGLRNKTVEVSHPKKSFISNTLTEKLVQKKINLNFQFVLWMQIMLLKSKTVDFFKWRMRLAALCVLISFISIMLLLSPFIVGQLMSVGVINGAPNTPAPSPTPMRFEHYYTPENNALYPITEFRLSVPKINLESNIVDNVDPNLEGEYKDKLQFGVAHAKGSYLPPEDGGPVYLFAHSTDTIFNIARFNAKFYSVRELEAGDEINVNFNGKQYTYIVTEKYVINPEEVDIVQTAKTDLILQTCWPPGTDWQRLIVLANRKDSQSI